MSERTPEENEAIDALGFRALFDDLDALKRAVANGDDIGAHLRRVNARLDGADVPPWDEP